MLGTCFVMYALMMSRGFVTFPVLGTIFTMTIISWNVSGGHFNPAITIGVYISKKDFGGNAVIAGIMVVA